MTQILSEEFLNNIKIRLENIKSTHEAEISLQVQSLTIFNNLLKCLKKRAIDNKLKLNSNTTLDIAYNYDIYKLKSYRITINQLNNINNILSNIFERENHIIFALLSSYILQNKSNITIIEKIKDINNIVNDNVNNLRFRLSEENNVEIEKIKKLQHITNDKRKSIIFRFKHRMSLILFEDEKIKISTDLTLVKTANKASFISTGKESYELEVEIIFKKDIKKLDSKYFNIFINEVIYLIKIMQSTEEIITIEESNIIINKLKEITSSDQKIKDLPGIQTVSAEIVHIVDTIPNDYSVTDKADGERHFLMIYNKNVYLISNNLIVKKIDDFDNKQVEKYEGTIIDGEYLLVKKHKKFMFLGFDILFHQGKDVREEQTLEKRYELLNDVTKNLFHQETFAKKYNEEFNLKKIETFYQKDIKKFIDYMNNTLDKSTKKNIVISKYFIFPLGGSSIEIYLYSTLIWNEYSNAPYLLDGLIYTPLKQKYTISVSAPKKTFKWKPSSKNSIDFYVLYERNSETKQIINVYDNSIGKELNDNEYDTNDNFKEKDKIYRILNLYVGKHEGGKETPVLFQKEEHNYIANIYLIDNEIRDIEGNIIEDNTVVEFAYDKTLPNNFRWIPLRTRMDKTDMVIKYRKKYGNAEWVANKNWRSIMDGIEISDIELLGKVDTYEKHIKYLRTKVTSESIQQMRQEDKYYKEKNNLAESLRQFNNFIKTNMISTYCGLSYKNKKMDVLDVGCGVGGDINKFYHARVNSYIGFDINYQNLYSVGDSAISRYNNFKKKYPGFTKMKFIQATASKLLDYNNQESFFGKMKEENKKLLIDTFGENENSKNYKTFDIINAQFTIHYFFENDNTLKNFIGNVKKYLRKDGFILITTFDGKIIHNKFNNEGKITSEYLSKDGNKSILFDINRLYPTDIKNLKQTGLAIDVLMKWITGDDYYKEYLVEPSFLVETMKKNDLSLVESDTFNNLFDIYKDYFLNCVQFESIKETNNYLSNAKKFYNDELSNFHTYSFLFRYYIFQKN